jgi:hypothetical protein
LTAIKASELTYDLLRAGVHSRARRWMRFLSSSRRHFPPAPAPAIPLHDTPDQMVAVNDFRGQPVVLAFCPADWSPVCSDQMVLHQESLPEFQKYNAQLLGISVNGVWCHLAFARDRGIAGSDFRCWPPSSRRARGFRERRAQRSERHADLLHQRIAARWRLGPAELRVGTARGSRFGRGVVTAARVKH